MESSWRVNYAPFVNEIQKHFGFVPFNVEIDSPEIGFLSKLSEHKII